MVLVVPLVAEVAAAAVAAADVSRSPRIAITCSNSLNCASCDTNWVPSVGFSGPWFLICATSSCRNMSVLGVVALVELDWDAPAAAAEAPVIALTEEACTLFYLYRLVIVLPGNALLLCRQPEDGTDG